MTEERSEANQETSTEAVQNALQQAVNKALERKRRLGEYAVVWRDGKPVRVGIDTPWSDVAVHAPKRP